MYLSKIREELEDIRDRIFSPKVMFYAYNGASLVCSISGSVALQKALRSKIPLNKLKYAGTFAAMSLASTACRHQAYRQEDERMLDDAAKETA